MTQDDEPPPLDIVEINRTASKINDLLRERFPPHMLGQVAIVLGRLVGCFMLEANDEKKFREMVDSQADLYLKQVKQMRALH